MRPIRSAAHQVTKDVAREQQRQRLPSGGLLGGATRRQAIAQIAIKLEAHASLILLTVPLSSNIVISALSTNES